MKLGMLENFAKGAAEAALGKAQDLVREFNDTVPTLKALGLSVTNISAKIGFPPEVGATLIGSVEALDQQKLRELSDRYRENKTIVVLLEALIVASNLKEQLSEIGFRGIKADVTLGVLPKVQVDLLAKAGAVAA